MKIAKHAEIDMAADCAADPDAIEFFDRVMAGGLPETPSYTALRERLGMT
jgi:hypothetical protein